EDIDELAQERDLLASLIEKLKCEINDSKNHNKVLETSNKALVNKLKEQVDWKDDTDDESDDQESEAHYMYIAQIQEVTPDTSDNFGPIFDAEPLQKVQNNDDNYNVFDDDQEYHVQLKSINEPYPNICYDREQDDQEDIDELAQERDLLASLIKKLKCEINDSKNRNKVLETSNKALVDKLKGEIEDFKTKNKSLESSNNHFKEANNELSKTNQLMFKDLKKFQVELNMYHDVNYASNVAIDCAKAKWDMKKELFAHQETISIMSQKKEAHIKFYKTREDKEINKVIALEIKVKVLDNIVYKTGQLVQTINMLNRNCKTSFAKPKFLKKAQRASPRLYDIGCYNDNLALMLAPESDEMIHLDKESRPELSNLIRPFDYDQLNNLYDLFVPQREKKCVLSDNHDICVLHYMNGVNSRTKQPIVVPISTREPKRTVNQYVATPLKIIVALDSTNQKPRKTTRKLYEHVSNTCSWWYPKFTPSGYKWKPKSPIGNINTNLVEIILFIVDSGCSKHMKGNLKLLTNFMAKFLGIRHKSSTAQTPKQNGIVERPNCTLVEAARTMLSATKVPLFFWAEAIATACFTQNRSLIIPRHEKIPYHIISGRKRSVKFFYIFSSLCYIVRYGENLDKMKEKVVSKSFAVHAADDPNKRQQYATTQSSTTTIAADIPPLNIQTTPETTFQESTQAPTVTATENINQAEMITKNVQVEDDEFMNIFCTPLPTGETSSRHVDSSNLHNSINDTLLNIVGRKIIC
nr:retrovirus-related Pol polyprotein from transposon TNT 1-94 [Tanacetum cinerariifolium]